MGQALDYSAGKGADLNRGRSADARTQLEKLLSMLTAERYTGIGRIEISTKQGTILNIEVMQQQRLY